MNTDLAFLLPLAAGVAGIAIGFVLGRRTGAVRARIVELEQQLEGLSKERELALAECEARKEELKRYRGQVAEHFADTSDLVRNLTHQYRAVYDHLARGASELCPEGAAEIAAGLGAEALPAASADEAEPAATASAPATGRADP